MRIAALLAVLFFSSIAAAQKMTPVRFALDWRFEGPAAPYLVAIDKGYYKAEGLDVTIDPGTGSVEGINRVASGAYDAGFWFSSYRNLKAQGIPDDEIVVLHMRDWGVDLYGNGIIANPDFMRFSPKAVAGFVRGTIKGIQETARDPDAAIESVMKRNQI